MDGFMRAMAPKGAWGFVIRLVLLVCVVAVANISFSLIFDDDPRHSIPYYLAHAVFVGGPLIAFFLAVTVFQVRLQRKLFHLSRIDTLTGLNNRRRFFELMERQTITERRGVLMVLDADNFKTINDTSASNYKANTQTYKHTSKTQYYPTTNQCYPQRRQHQHAVSLAKQPTPNTQ